MKHVLLAAAMAILVPASCPRNATPLRPEYAAASESNGTLFFPKLCHPTCGLEINLRRLKELRSSVHDSARALGP